MESTYLNTNMDIEERLNRIFKERLNIHISDKDALLFSNRIGLTASDLVYICFDIEKEFGILIDDNCIENHMLTTFANMENFIYSRLPY